MYKAITYGILLCLLASTAIATEPAKPVGGRVVDEKGQPLAAAKVTAFQFQANASSRGEYREASSVVTGADGRFLFDGPIDTSTLAIVAIKEGKCMDWADPLSGLAGEPVLQLGPAATIEGEIVDEAGKPVEGASVVALLGLETPTARTMFRPLASDILRTKTAAQGRFSFANLPAAATVGFDLTAPGRARALADGRFTPGQKGLRFVLPPEGRIEGVVVEKDGGRALASVGIKAVGSLTSGVHVAQATTDKEGRFSAAGLGGGKYTLEITGTGKDLPEWIGKQENVPVEPGKAAADVKIEAVRGGILELAFIDAATHGPVAPAGWLNVCPAEDLRIRHAGYVSKEGVVKLCLAPGNYVVTEVWAAGYAYKQEKGQSFRVEAGKTARAALAVTAAAQVTGLVRDPKGQPVPQANVRILPMTGTARDVVAGADGRFTITAADIGPMACFLLVRHPKENLVAIGLAALSEKPPEITLFPPTEVSGAVVDSQGRPVAGASVQAQIDASHMGRFAVVASAVTDKDGRYRMELAPMSADYAISARAPGYSAAEVAVPQYQVAEGKGKLKDLVLGAADRVVQGAVKDAQGRPVAGAIISAVPSGGGPEFPESRVTDDKGQFTLEHMSNQTDIRVGAKVPGRGWIGDSALKPGQTDVVIRVEPSHWD